MSKKLNRKRVVSNSVESYANFCACAFSTCSCSGPACLCACAKTWTKQSNANDSYENEYNYARSSNYQQYSDDRAENAAELN